MPQPKPSPVRQLLDAQAAIGAAIFYLTENEGGFMQAPIRQQIEHAINVLKTVDISEDSANG